MRILELTLFTKNINRIKEFYSSVLGLPIREEHTDHCIFGIGHSKLTFIQKHGATPYHFAFDIPSNQELEAHRWLSDRVELIKDGDNEIIDFKSWNAKAIYFYDPDDNIVEFIARKNLDNQSDRIFCSTSLVSISEIGLAVKNILPTLKYLKEELGLKPYIGESPRFTAMGDEIGLIICIDSSLKKWYPPMDEAYPSHFELVAEIDGISQNINLPLSSGV